MAHIKRFEVFAVDLPLKKPFTYADEERSVSDSIFVKGITDTGTVGFGETVPRQAVTGESRDYAYELLRDSILPHLIGKRFNSFEDVRQFLYRCDGKAPSLFPDAHLPQNSSWCAAELTLLDAFGREFNESLFGQLDTRAKRMHRYSGIVLSDEGIKFFSAAMKMLIYGFPLVKIKVGKATDLAAIRGLKNLLGSTVELHVDAEMTWNAETARALIPALREIGVNYFEQPLAKDDIEGLARLREQTKADIIADESFTDRVSLDTLIAQNACSAVNIRIAKCGGLIASQRFVLEAVAAGLTVKVGAYVGESSLLSAAQVALITQFPEIKYVEGCFGAHALKEDPVSPLMQFRQGGRLPPVPKGYGFGTTVDEDVLRRFTVRTDVVS